MLITFTQFWSVCYVLALNKTFIRYLYNMFFIVSELIKLLIN